MSYFTDFLDDELDLIISIPVRAGFWMSQIDDAPGTQRDEEKELLALEKVLRKIERETDDRAFTNDVMEEAIRLRGSWAQWSQTAATLLDDLPRALAMIRDRLPKDADIGYRKAVYYIANVVAQAASEQSGDEGKRSGLFDRLVDKISVKSDMKQPENVSETEKAALQKLLQCLKG